MDPEPVAAISPNIHFCPECNNLLVPNEDNNALTYKCQVCEYKEIIELTDKSQYELYRIHQKETLLKKENVEYDTQYALDPTMPRMRGVTCPKCAHNEAVFLLIETGNGKLMKVFVCARVDENYTPCGESWNDVPV